jgi:hypothetical protein
MQVAVELCHKGMELMLKGHFARAAEKLAAAVAAAEAVQPADCLVLAELRLRLVGAVSAHSSLPGVLDAEKAAGRRKCWLTLLPAVIATVQRRTAAGTILPGRCLPEEEALYWELKRPDPAKPPPTEANFALTTTLLGRDVSTRAAIQTVPLLFDTPRGDVPYLSDEQLLSFDACVASALDLMLVPYQYNAGTVSLTRTDTMLLTHLKKMSDNRVNNIANSSEAQLPRAWRSVQLSGVLDDERVIGIGSKLAEGGVQYIVAAQNVPASSLRGCQLAACAAREAHVSHFRLCGACKQAVYCCKEHQVSDWPAHRRACKAAQNAAAERADAAAAAS